MIRPRLDGLSTSGLLRLAVEFLNQDVEERPHLQVRARLAGELVKRAELMEQAAQKELAGRPGSSWSSPGDLLREIGEVRP